MQIFLPSLRVVLLLHSGFPLVHKCFMVNLVPFSALWFIFHYFKRWIHKELAACMLNHVLFIFFLNNFIFAFRYLYYLGFVYTVKKEFSNFILLMVEGTLTESFIKTVTNFHPKHGWRNVPFISIPSPAVIVCTDFDSGHSDWCDVIP